MTSAISVSKQPPEKSVPVRHWIAIMGGMLGAFMAILDIQITNSSLRDIQGALSATLSESSWISTSYLVAEMIAIPLSGWLSKALGKRRYITWTTVLFATSSLLCSLSWNMTSIIIFRAIQGFSGGALIPLAFSMVTQFLPPSKRPIGMAIFGITATFAPTIGPTLGGWLTEHFSWHYIFYINLPPALIMITMIRFGLTEEKLNLKKLKEADWFGIFTMAIGLGCLEVVLEEGNREDWFNSQMILTLGIISAVSLIYFVMHELMHKKPLVNLKLLKEPQFATSCIAFFILGIGLFGSIYVLPVYLAQIQQYTAMEIGLVLMWMGFPQLLIFPLMPKLSRIIKPTYLVAFGFSLFALSCYLNTHMNSNFSGGQLIISMVVRAIGNPFIMVPISMVAMKKINIPDTPDASTLVNMMRNLGGAFSIAIIATLLSNRTTQHLAYIKESVSSISQLSWQSISQRQALFMQTGSDAVTAMSQAQASIATTMQRDAAIMAYNDIFVLMTAFLAIAAVLMLTMKD